MTRTRHERFRGSHYTQLLLLLPLLLWRLFLRLKSQRPLRLDRSHRLAGHCRWAAAAAAACSLAGRLPVARIAVCWPLSGKQVTSLIDPGRGPKGEKDSLSSLRLLASCRAKRVRMVPPPSSDKSLPSQRAAQHSSRASARAIGSSNTARTFQPKKSCLRNTDGCKQFLKL